MKHWTPDELRACPLARPLKMVYHALGCSHRWRIARQLVHLIMKLEGGASYSATARELLMKYHGVEIGAYSYGSCLLPGVFASGTTVGRYCSISWDVRAFSKNHPMDRLSTHPFFYDERLGMVGTPEPHEQVLQISHDVWIGAGVILTAGCKRIGLGAVIGAGSVVTKDVPDFAIVAGNPARLVRYRFDDATQKIIRGSRWWEQSAEECIRHLDDMIRPLGSHAALHPLLHAAVN